MDPVILPTPAVPERARWVRLAGQFVLDSGLLAGGSSVAALLVLVFLWQFQLGVSLALAFGVYLGVAMLVPENTPGTLIVDGLTVAEFDAVVATVRDKLARIEQEAQRVTGSEASIACVGAIGQTAAAILRDFEDCPRHLADARFAFDTLLEATRLALERHHKFACAGGSVAQRGLKALHKRVLPTILHGFEQLLGQLLNDDLRALDVDVVVLEQMLELEGLAADVSAPDKEIRT